MNHDCQPPIGPGTPDTWTCPDCHQTWERRQPDDPTELLAWRKTDEDSIQARCPYCRLLGTWVMPGSAAVDGNHFTPPRGHTVHEVDGNPAHRTDTCPVASTDPRAPWRPIP